MRFWFTILLLRMIVATTVAGGAEENLHDVIVALALEYYDGTGSASREATVGKAIALDEPGRIALHDVARETHDGKVFWGVSGIAAKMGDEETADVFLGRLLDAGDRFLPGYLGAAIVDIKGATAYRDLEQLALQETGDVRGRIIHGIGYSGYATHEHPVPTLVFLAEKLEGVEREAAYKEADFVLSQCGMYVQNPKDRMAIASLVLRWIHRSEIRKPDEELRRLPECPFPPRDSKVPMRSGLRNDKLGGGAEYYVLRGSRVRRVVPGRRRSSWFRSAADDVPPSAHNLSLKQKGDFAIAEITAMSSEPLNHTRFAFLLKREKRGWVYAGYHDLTRSTICLY